VADAAWRTKSRDPDEGLVPVFSHVVVGHFDIHDDPAYASLGLTGVVDVALEIERLFRREGRCAKPRYRRPERSGPRSYLRIRAERGSATHVAYREGEEVVGLVVVD